MFSGATGFCVCVFFCMSFGRFGRIRPQWERIGASSRSQTTPRVRLRGLNQFLAPCTDYISIRVGLYVHNNVYHTIVVLGEKRPTLEGRKPINSFRRIHNVVPDMWEQIANNIVLRYFPKPIPNDYVQRTHAMEIIVNTRRRGLV